MTPLAKAERPILITGGSGQVGTELVRLLSAFGPVLVPSSSELDLASPKSIVSAMRSIRPALILNAGAYTAVDMAETDAELCHAVNAEAPRILAGAARDHDAAIIHYSTDYVFDGSKGGPYVENDATGPLNTYGRTKALGEEHVRKSGAASIVLRCSWIYSMTGSNFLRSMLGLRDRPALSVVDDQYGAPTWAREIAVSTISIVNEARRSSLSLPNYFAKYSGTYHLTAAGRTTWKGFAEEIFRRAGGDCPTVTGISTEEYGAPARRPRNSVLDNAKIAATFGIRMPSWETQLNDCLGSG